MPQIGQTMGPLNSANAGQSLQDARSEKILGQFKVDKNSSHPKLERAAHAFESILLDKWLEDAQHAFAAVPGEDPDKNDEGNVGADQYRSLALQAVAEKISESGGIGIASMIVRHLENRNPGTEAEPSDSKAVSTQGTEGGLPPRNRIKVSIGKDR